MSTTTMHYELTIGGTFSPHAHNTLKECIDQMNTEYKGRKKKDGYDEYWQNRPFEIRKVTTTYENIPIK